MFTCEICGKEFKTGPALGGHTSSAHSGLKGSGAQDDGHKGPKKTLTTTTTATSEAAFLSLVPKTQQVVLTPSIFMSFMCALKRGYKGDLGDWISLACSDFWLGREIDFYKEVTGIEPQESGVPS